MKTALCAVGALFAVAGCGRGEARESRSAVEVTAHVRLEPLTRRDLVEEVPLYGEVVTGPESAKANSVTFDAVVRGVFVRVGEPVTLGEPLVEVEASRDAKLALRQAHVVSVAADEVLRAVRERLSTGLATRSELTGAERDARAAALDVRSLIERGVARRRQVRAAGPGVVVAVHAGVGDLVAANASLVDLNLRRHREVRLGLEVEDAGRIAAGSTLTVRDLALPPASEVHATVRAVGESVDPATRLVDVYAALPQDSRLLLHQRVAATASVHSGPVLVVPRSAILPLPDALLVFTVDHQGVAHAHQVRKGMENATEVEIAAPDLREGDRVVVTGAAVLVDGMRTVEDAE
ncbi:MAG: HlyD family efflux transporter periplasmic adaptor subunit [Deltaproteobacteria bacterium]|nr:HlyD family efflux transporter periplasmic adaptor subunit [Deltaproteobacteria bacterium]